MCGILKSDFTYFFYFILFIYFFFCGADPWFVHFQPNLVANRSFWNNYNIEGGDRHWGASKTEWAVIPQLMSQEYLTYEWLCKIKCVGIFHAFRSAQLFCTCVLVLHKLLLKYLYYHSFLSSWLFVWVYGISTFIGYLMPNPFLYK